MSSISERFSGHEREAGALILSPDKMPAAHPRDEIVALKKRFKKRLPISPARLQRDLERLGEPELFQDQPPQKTGLNFLARLKRVFTRTT